MVERQLAKVEAAGSKPVSRSNPFVASRLEFKSPPFRRISRHRPLNPFRLSSSWTNTKIK